MRVVKQWSKGPKTFLNISLGDTKNSVGQDPKQPELDQF